VSQIASLGFQAGRCALTCWIRRA